MHSKLRSQRYKPCISSYPSFLIPSSGLTIGYGHMRDNSRETQRKPKKSVANNNNNNNNKIKINVRENRGEDNQNVNRHVLIATLQLAFEPQSNLLKTLESVRRATKFLDFVCNYG